MSIWEQHAEGSQAKESRTGRRKERIQCDGAWGTRRQLWVVGCSSGEEHGRFPEGNGEPRCVLSRQRLVQVTVGEFGQTRNTQSQPRETQELSSKARFPLLPLVAPLIGEVGPQACIPPGTLRSLPLGTGPNVI